MILTLKEQTVIKNWNKKGLGGLRLSSLVYLDNIGGPFERDSEGLYPDSETRMPDRVAEMLIKFTLSLMPQGLWHKAEIYCAEICFIAGVDFDESVFYRCKVEEEGEREDEEFDDGWEED